MIGGIPIKRAFLVFTVIIICTMFTACGLRELEGSNAASVATEDVSIGTTSELTGTTATDNTETLVTNNDDTVSQNKTGDDTDYSGANEQLLQSASVDLDADGESEQVAVVQISADSTEAGNTGELVGQLIIRKGNSNSKITFWKKNSGLTGLLTSMQFEDLDGDGAKDVFIIIPDNGASFSISNYFVYSFKKNISYSFTSDNSLVDFINEFSFKYAGDNKLSIINSKYNFSADLAIELENDQEPEEDYMKDYEQHTWIDPVSVDISENSRLAMTSGANGRLEIKVPLPVFGLATVDMIGEVDLYFTMDNNMSPVLKRFEVMDFKGTDMVKVGNCEIK